MHRRRISLTAILVLILAIAGWWTLGSARRLPEPVLVRVPPGAGRRAIASRLQQAGVVRSAAGFELWSLLRGRDTLKAGVYRFPGQESVPAVFDRIARGLVYTIAFAVPEGYNRFQIARALDAKGLAEPHEFLAATADPAPIRDLDPEAVSLEGYLFPATYRISPGEPVSQIVTQMLRRFRQEVRRDKIPPGGVHRWVTMASLVQSETPVEAERALIAGVFENRLTQNLPLQCDPTVIYAELLEGKYTGALHHADMSFPSPYNTYLHTGLPPGPIANPGRESLEAAAHPAATRYLYFVSTGHGSHRFARTLAEQEHNVQLLRQSLQRR